MDLILEYCLLYSSYRPWLLVFFFFKNKVKKLIYCGRVLQSRVHSKTLRLLRLTTMSENFKKMTLKYNRLTHCGFLPVLVLLLSLINSTSGSCQKDTLSKNQIDSLVSWIGYINADLTDYDLLKHKASLQSEKVRRLELIDLKNREIGEDAKARVYNCLNSVLVLQKSNDEVRSQLATLKRQKRKARFENWMWRGSVLLFTSLKIYVWLN